MAELNVRNLSKSYGVKEIFNNIDFSVDKNDKIGLIGLNGSGKTTLLNIISDEDNLYEGNVDIKNRVSIGYLRQNLGLISSRTVYEEMLDAFREVFNLQKELKALEKLMGDYSDKEELNNTIEKYNSLMEKYEEIGGLSYKSQIKGMLKGMGFSENDYDKDIDKLSGGEKSRLELGKLLLSKPDILLLDEPTNHLDISAINFLEDYLRDFKGAIIVISHDRYFLDNVVNRIFLMENKSLYIYNTNYSEYIKRRKKDIEVLKAQYENQQKEIERQKEIIERFKNLGGSLRKRGISQSRSRQKLLDKMQLVEEPNKLKGSMKIRFTPKYESGEDVLRVRNLAKSFSQKKLFSDVSFDIYKKEKVSLIGGNGTGKSTFFNIILNKIKPDDGIIEIGDSVKIAYFDQEQKTLDDDNTIIDEIWDAYPNLQHYDIRSYLAKFNFFGDDIFKFIGDLSGGEKSRVALLKLMLSDGNFLLMDEPTNHLDIESKEVLEDAINSYEGTCLVISHDRYFINRISEKILVLEDGEIKEYLGNYDYYRMKEAELLEQEETTLGVTKTQIKKEEREKKKNLKEIRKIKKEIRDLESTIQEYEEKLKDLKELSYDPSIYENHIDALELMKSIRELEEKISNATDEWIKLSDEFEE